MEELTEEQKRQVVKDWIISSHPADIVDVLKESIPNVVSIPWYPDIENLQSYESIMIQLYLIFSK